MPILGVFVFPFWGHVKKYRFRWNFSFVVKRYLPSKGDMKIRSRSLSLGLSVWTINNRHFNIHSHLIQWDLFFFVSALLSFVCPCNEKRRKKENHPTTQATLFPSFLHSIHPCVVVVFYLSCRFLSRGITKALQKIGHFGFGRSY